MLILSRHESEAIKIPLDEVTLRKALTEVQQTGKPVDITVMVSSIRGNRAQLGFEAPRYVPVLRTEIQEHPNEQSNPANSM